MAVVTRANPGIAWDWLVWGAEVGVAVFAALAVFVAGIVAGGFVPPMRRVGVVERIAVFAGDLVGGVPGLGGAGASGRVWMSGHAALPFLPKTLPECLPVALVALRRLIGEVAAMWRVCWRLPRWLDVDLACDSFQLCRISLRHDPSHERLLWVSYRA